MPMRSDPTPRGPAFPTPVSDEERETETDQSWPAIGVVTASQPRGAVLWGFLGGGREAELEGDVGNQIGPPPLVEKIRDPDAARRAVEDVRSASRHRETPRPDGHG